MGRMASLAVLERDVYSTGEAARVLGVPAATFRRWLEGAARAGKFYEPVIRPVSTGSDIVTWGEFVEAGLIREYRARRVSFQHLRLFITRLREELGVPFPLAHARPWVDDRRLLRRIEQEMNVPESESLIERDDGQLALTPIAQAFMDKVDFDEASDSGVVLRYLPLGRGSALSADPEISFGVPQVDGIRSEILAELYQSGESIESLAADFSLPIASVRDGLRWELDLDDDELLAS
jgi:uncharacterized protein (DUF433 family)